MKCPSEKFGSQSHQNYIRQAEAQKMGILDRFIPNQSSNMFLRVFE
jgi:hypothetical protein